MICQPCREGAVWHVSALSLHEAGKSYEAAEDQRVAILHHAQCTGCPCGHYTGFVNLIRETK